VVQSGKYQSSRVAFFARKDSTPIERLSSVTELRAKKRREIFAAHPESDPGAPVDQLSEVAGCKRAAEDAHETTAFANGEVLRELRACLALPVHEPEGQDHVLRGCG
jgi:hypothetical protein